MYLLNPNRVTQIFFKLKFTYLLSFLVMPQKYAAKRLTLDADEPSLLFAINELLATGGIDFDEWWDEFSQPPVNQLDREGWTKPKFVDITPKGKSNIGRWIK